MTDEITHDEFTESVIEFLKPSGKERKRVENFEFTVEAHYNHYGARGVADLYVVKEVNPLNSPDSYNNHSVNEIKTRLESANKVLRQFKRMQRYFFKDQDRRRPDYNDYVGYNLWVLATEKNIKHLLAHKELYRDSNPYIFHPSMEWQVPANYLARAQRQGELDEVKKKFERVPGDINFESIFSAGDTQ